MASQSDLQRKAQLLSPLFLLRCLPTDRSDQKLQMDCSLLRLFSDFLHCPELSKIRELDSMRQAFELWADLQSTKKIDPIKLATAIGQLKNGQHLPLLVRSQNACLLLSVPSLGTDENADTRDDRTNSSLDTSEESNGAVISTFPANLPRTFSLKAPTFVYPTTSVRVAFSSFLQSKCLAEQISYLDEHTIEKADNNLVYSTLL